MAIQHGVNDGVCTGERAMASGPEQVGVIPDAIPLSPGGLEYVDIPEEAPQLVNDDNGSSAPVVTREANLGRVARLPGAETNYPSTQLISEVSQAIDSVLAGTKLGTIGTGVLASIVFNGQRVPRREFRAFVTAANRDPRLKYIGDGMYKVINREEEHTVLPGGHTLETIVDRTIEALSGRTRADFNAQQALGVVRSLGITLSSANMDRFYAKIVGDSRIGVLESGSFVVKKLQDEYEETGDIVRPFNPNNDPREFRNEDGRPLSAKQVDLAMRAITYGPEVREARDRAMRTGKPKRRGHQSSNSGNVKKALKGKAHGKKVSLDDLIDGMNTDLAD